VRKLAVHEVAEEDVVHPLTRQAPEGDAVAEARLKEESKGKDLLAELEEMGVDHPEFDARLETLRSEVLAHAKREEEEEHPKLEQAVEEKRLRELATSSGPPSRPLPRTPTERGRNPP
jgi:hypothetical protein